MGHLFSSSWLPKRWRPAPPVPVPAGWLCSFPKCGRTWLRFILSNYLNQVFSLGQPVDLRTMFFIMPNCDLDAERGLRAYRYTTHRRMQLIAVSHLPYQRKFTGRPVVFLMRSVSDAIVSFYFHNSRQWSHYRGTLSEFLRDAEWGVPRLVSYMNAWAGELRGESTRVVTYERLKQNAEAEVLQVLRFLGLPEDAPALRRAIELAAVDRMRELEIRQPLPGHRYDPSDVDARRVRKARVGAGLEHLTPADTAYITAYCREHFSAAALALYAQHNVPLVAGSDENVAAGGSASTQAA